MSPILQTNESATGGAGTQRDRDFTSRRFHLQAVGFLEQDRQQPVIGVLAHAPEGGVGGRRVVEDAEEGQRLGRAVLGEVRFLQPQAQCQPGHQPVAQAGQRRHVLQHRRAQARGPFGEEVGPVKRRAGQDPRIVGGQLGAEVQALLLVGLAGGQLVADTEVAPPGPAPQGHADRQLRPDVLGEELPAELAQATLERCVHPVPDDVEEPALAAGLAETFGDGPRAGVARDQFAHLDDRDVREVTLCFHASCSFAAPGMQPAEDLKGAHFSSC
jgi:hypothetical protein